MKNIGLHVGGGPNDAATKAPLQAAVARWFGQIERCYASVEPAGASGTFGIDLTIPAGGGVPKLSEPRTALGPEAFRSCVSGVLRQVEFPASARGAMTISYSLSFKPRAAARR